MKESNVKKDLGFLGLDFQEKLVNQLIVDKKFTNDIIDILDPNYFTDENLRIIVGKVKDCYKNYEIIPDYEGLKIRINAEVINDISKNMVLETIDKLKDLPLKDVDYIKDLTDKFAKQQNLIKTLGEIRKIIEIGDIQRYSECEDLIKKALNVGHRENGFDKILDDLPLTLAEKREEMMLTGINGLDEILKFKKNCLTCIIAPTGVGKTSMAVRMANGLANNGRYVLQMFFEDTLESIKLKIISLQNNISVDKVQENKEKIIENKELLEKINDFLALKKFPSGIKSFNQIKQYLKKIIADGFPLEALILDYFECLQMVQNQNLKQYEGEALVMRNLEALAEELNILIITFSQGGRSSVKSSIIQADEIGGAFAKSQIAHKLLSISKSEEQKSNGTATIAILKNRGGNVGIFEDITFNNETLEIDLTKNGVLNPINNFQFTKNKEQEAEDYVNSILKLGQGK